MSRKLTVFSVVFLALLLNMMGSRAQQGELNFSLDPRYGSVDLTTTSGFPYEVSEVDVGGDIDASSIESCVGYTTEEPTFRVNWSDGNGSTLSFYFNSREDTTLIINTANGDWVCNDDSDGLNPRVDIANAPEGQYDIWVGRFSPDTQPVGTLGVTTDAAEVGDSLCPEMIALIAFDPEVIDDSTVMLQYQNREDQIFEITVTGDGVGSERYQTVMEETRLCLRATAPLVLPDAVAVDQSPEQIRERDNETELVSFDISVVDIGDLVEVDYEVHFAIDPSTPQSYKLASAQSATVSSLCGITGNSVTARLYNPNRIASNPNTNLVYTLPDNTGGNCARMRRSNGTTLYVTAKEVYVSGSPSGSYFTMTGTWGTKN